ncbi:MAG: helix-turn-helix domain-containing protein [Bacteroidales bacterium]|nr:helix-turn-helix domain-containing protein [Bacteroidales bacterium]
MDTKKIIEIENIGKDELIILIEGAIEKAIGKGSTNNKEDNIMSDYIALEKFQSFLGCSKRTVNRLLHDYKALSYVSIGRKCYLLKEDVKKFLESRKIKSKENNLN